MLPYLLAFCRITISLTFTYSFLMKVGDVNQFAQTVANFKLVPLRWERPLALLFLSGEAAVVVFLVIGGQQLLPLAFILALLLLLAFTAALALVLVRDIQTSCNCFGNTQKTVSYVDVWRNAGLILVSAIGLWTAGNVKGTLNLIELFLIAIIAIIFVLLWTNLTDIVTLFQTA